MSTFRPEPGYAEIRRADDGELSVAPWLVPNERAAKPVAGVTHPRDKPRDLGQKPPAALEIDRAHDDVAFRGPVSEKSVRRRG